MGSAAGRASQLPPPSASGKPPPSASGKPPPSTTTDSAKIKPNIQLPKPAASSAKRKLVGSASLEVGDGDGKIDSGKAGKKKKKGKGMLSFDDAEEGG